MSEAERSPDKMVAAEDKKRRTLLDKPPSVSWPTMAEILRDAARRKAGIPPYKAIIAGTRGYGRLTVGEVFYYRLFDGDVGIEEVKRFVGKVRQNRFHQLCNQSTWFAAAHDKALFYTLMRGAGVRIPQTVAISGLHKRSGYKNHLENPQQIAKFLSNWTEWPLFAKPIDGMYSIGGLKLTGSDKERVAVQNYGWVTSAELAQYITTMSDEGYLFQRCLAPLKAAPAEGCGSPPSVRFLILLSNKIVSIESAIIKLPSKHAVVDNYWKPGNLVGALDVETGQIVRVVSGAGPSMNFFERHPEDGRPLVGAVVPHWGDICAVAIEGASTFPGVRTQSWDVALTESGPVALELNFGGDLNLHQIAHRRGALTDSYIDHLRSCGYKGRRP